MPLTFNRTAAAVFLILCVRPLAAQTPPISPSPNVPASLAPAPTASSFADLTLGGYPVLRLRSSAGGMTPQERIDRITERLTPLLGVPNIHPSDVVVYLPPADSHVNRAPVIYALGRKLITVDAATVASAGGGGTPLMMAKKWAARLQQVLPRVNWRPSNAPDPKVPPHPPLIVTHDFAQVGGMVGIISLRGKIILKLRGPQPGGVTAAERADLLTSRLNHLADGPDASGPDAVQAAAQPDGTAVLTVTGTPLVTVTAPDAKAAGFTKPIQLAQGWAKNLRTALIQPPPAPLLPVPPTQVPTPDTTPTPAPIPDTTPTPAPPPASDTAPPPPADSAPTPPTSASSPPPTSQ